MNTDDVTLQELIVRALTGSDPNARKSLAATAAADPELQKFCTELEDIVGVLSGSNDWRSMRPSAELTAKIRQAVVAKLPAAPPHFRTVLLETDMGRRRATRRIIVIAIAVAVSVAALIYFGQRQKEDSGRLQLTGKLIYESIFKPEALKDFELVRETQWEGTADGLHSKGSEESGAVYLKKSLNPDGAVAFNVDIHVPDLGDASSVTVFLADAGGENNVAFDGASRPRGGLSLEITGDGLVLNGPDHALLHSKPEKASGAHFYRLRLEYLGRHARALVNGETFFDGPLTRPLRGPLYAGMRVSGSRKNEIFFNAARVER